MTFLVSLVFHVLRLLVGRKRALRWVDAALCRLARAHIERTYAQLNEKTTEEAVRYVYDTLARGQNAVITTDWPELTIVVKDCMFARGFRRWGAEEITHALCRADREFWQARGQLIAKTTRFETPEQQCTICLNQVLPDYTI